MLDLVFEMFKALSCLHCAKANEKFQYCLMPGQGALWWVRGSFFVGCCHLDSFQRADVTCCRTRSEDRSLHAQERHLPYPASRLPKSPYKWDSRQSRQHRSASRYLQVEKVNIFLGGPVACFWTRCSIPGQAGVPLLDFTAARGVAFPNLSQTMQCQHGSHLGMALEWVAGEPQVDHLGIIFIYILLICQLIIIGCVKHVVGGSWLVVG